MGAVNGVHGVIDRRVQERKAVGRMDGFGLRARGANNHQQGSVPLHNLVDRLGGGVIWTLRPSRKRSRVRLADLGQETGAHKRERDQQFYH